MKLKHIFFAMSASLAVLAGCQKPVDFGPEEVTINIPSGTVIDVPVEGTEFTVSLKATVDWALQGYTDEVRSWLSISPESGKAAKDAQTITVKVLANEDVDRKADIVFYGNKMCKAPLTISQKGAKGGGDNPGPGTDPKAIYSVDFTAGQGDFTVDTKNGPEAVDIWKQSSTYGMVATAYVDGTNYDSESWLISPVIDLSAEKTAYLSFEHACNFFSDIATAAKEVSVKVRIEGGEWTAVEGVNYPEKLSWTFVSSGSVDLSAYAGKKIQLAFVYTSTSTKAGTWEIKNVTVTSEAGEDPGTPDIPDGAITWDITPDAQGWAEATDDTYGKGYSATVDGISVGYYQYKSTSTAIAPSSDHIRVYKSSVLKIDSEKTITKVILYCTASDKCVDMTVLEGDGNGFTADTASLTIEWTGNAKNIVAQASNGQVRITKIVFVCE